MTMKTNLVFALAAVLAVAPLVATAAAEKKDAAEKKEVAEKKDAPAKKDAAEEKSDEVTPAMLKARKLKKPTYTKFDPAKTAAEKCGQPMLVALLPQLPKVSEALQELKQKVLKHKAFEKDFALKNCVLLVMTVKVDSKDPKQIDLKPLKEPEQKFLENFVVSQEMISRAKQYNQTEPKYTDTKCYPVVICVDSTCQRELFRLGSYDKEGGFGVWLSTVADSFRSKGIEPEISPLVQKILDNPDDKKKWK